MATSIIPSLLDALVTECSAALTTVAVHDGYGVSGDVHDNLMIGVDDPFSDQAAPTAESQQSWANVGSGRSRDESGDVTCAAYATSGTTDQAAVRAAAFAITEAVENLLRTDPTVGLGDTVRTQFGTDQRFLQDQDEDGAWALIVFTIHFDARI
jgi:hypothetical protein